MDTNETGREPTDAELLRKLMDIHQQCGAFDNEWGEKWNTALLAVYSRGEEYLSGQRPLPESGVSRSEMLRMSTDTMLKAEAERLPDTPAPDEAAHKGSCVMVHRALYTQICEERAALTARVAVLEAELAVIEKWASVVEDEEPGSAVSRAFARGYDAARRWVAMWFKNDAAPGKEPTSE